MLREKLGSLIYYTIRLILCSLGKMSTFFLRILSPEKSLVLRRNCYMTINIHMFLIFEKVLNTCQHHINMVIGNCQQKLMWNYIVLMFKVVPSSLIIMFVWQLGKLGRSTGGIQADHTISLEKSSGSRKRMDRVSAMIFPWLLTVATCNKTCSFQLLQKYIYNTFQKKKESIYIIIIMLPCLECFSYATSGIWI